MQIAEVRLTAALLSTGLEAKAVIRWVAMFEQPELVALHPDRADRELAALWARASVLFNRDHKLAWTIDRMIQIAAIPASHFVTTGHRAMAREMARCHQHNLPFDDNLATIQHSVSAGEVQGAMKLAARDLVVEFRAMARLPMTRNIAITPFGGTSGIELRASTPPPHTLSYSQELTSIIVSVPIHNYSNRAQPTDLNDFDRIDLSREWTIARSALEHILNVLRLKQVQVLYSDYNTNDGSPFRSFTKLKFGDGTTRHEGTLLESGWIATWTQSPNIASAPIHLNPDLFAQTYNAAATEIALLNNSLILNNIDSLRRHLLIIESTYSKPEHGIPATVSEFEAALREAPFINRLENLRAAGEPSLLPWTDNLNLATELAQLRHLVSHLQLRDAHGNRIKQRSERFGVDPFDQDLQARVHLALSATTVIARQIVSELVPSQTFEVVRDRSASIHELMKLRAHPHYLHDPAGRELLARKALSRWFDEKDTNPEMANLVIELLNDESNQQLAKSFVHLATQLPETHDQLILAIFRNQKDFAEHAIQVIRIHDQELYARLKIVTPENRLDIFTLLDDDPLSDPGT